MTTGSRHAHAIAPSLSGQKFEAARPDAIWLADMTCVPTDEGWLHVDHLRAELCERTLLMSIQRRQLPEGLSYHSDGGVQGGLKRSSQHFKKDVVVAKRKRVSDRCLRGVLRSPGRPPVTRREGLVRFWTRNSSRTYERGGCGRCRSFTGCGSSVVSWGGCMPPTHLSKSSKPLSGRYLSFTECEEIAILQARGRGVRKIARRLRLDFPDDEAP